MQSNFIEIKLRHGCFPVNLLHIFITPFPENTSERFFLSNQVMSCLCENILEWFVSRWICMWKLVLFMDVNNVLEIQTISLHAVLKYITQRQFVRTLFKGSPPLGALMKGCSENLQQIYKRTPKPKCDFNKVAQQLYLNHTSAWVFSCKFAACFQNTFK